MRILHYFLGFHRAGGLNRYASDLAREQARLGDEVFALFPGGTLLPRHRPAIRRRPACGGVVCFELSGGAPVPLLFGIRDPRMILGDGRRLRTEAVVSFCDAVHPDILHIHTWMGFPKELMTELKRRGVKIVFTTHDYFGLCPKVNFIDAAGAMCDSPDDRKCSVCNAAAPSERALAIRNCRTLLAMKNILRPFAGRGGSSGGAPDAAENVKRRDYTALREYYLELLRQCDVVHANSSVSAEVYKRFAPDLSPKIVPISHAGIGDRRRRLKVGKTVKLAFSGPTAEFKGLPLLLRVLKELYASGLCNWHLCVWGAVGGDDCPNIKYRGSYDPSRHAEVYGGADLLIVPSVWNETFGFVVPEALSFGTPVLCSDTVGAQSLVSPDMVFHGEGGLREKLEFLLRAPEELERLNRAICEADFEFGMETHTKKMSALYNGTLS